MSDETAVLPIWHRLLNHRMAANIKRWHTWPTLRQQTVGAHSQNVAMLTYMIHPLPTVSVLMAALTHDLPELSTGDVPAHVKWVNPEIERVLTCIEQSWSRENLIIHESELDEFDLKVLKFCDGFELMLWSIEELRMGNAYMILVLHKIIPRLTSSIAEIEDQCPQAREVFTCATLDATMLISNYKYTGDGYGR